MPLWAPCLRSETSGHPVRGVTLVVPPSAVATPRKSAAAFTAAVMAGVAYVALPIPRLVGVEVIECMLAAVRQRSCVTMMRIEAVIDVAVEAVRAVEPGTRSEEHPTNEPIRSIVAIGSTAIRGVVKVSVRAHRGRSNAYTDGDLSRCQGRTA